MTNETIVNVIENLRKALFPPKEEENVLDRRVATVLRIAEDHGSLALLSHQCGSNSLFLPITRVNHGETLTSGALRGLREEIGVNLPSTYRLVNFGTKTCVEDHVDVKVSIFVADVPLSWIFSNYRSKEIARRMGTTLRRTAFNEDMTPDKLPVSYPDKLVPFVPILWSLCKTFRIELLHIIVFHLEY